VLLISAAVNQKLKIDIIGYMSTKPFICNFGYRRFLHQLTQNIETLKIESVEAKPEYLA